MSERVLTINNLCVSYGDVDVVCGIDISMEAGDITCIVGESGSGKTTLLRAIHGLERTYINHGEVVFQNDVIASRDVSSGRKYMGRHIGLIPQNPGGSFNPLRPLEKQFKESYRAAGMDYDREELIRIFDKVGLSDGASILKSRPYEMSGGMNQRIAIAAAFALHPSLLLCDEPASALDVTTAGMVVDQLMELRREKNTAILMVTHHLGIARRMADHAGIMKNGRMVEYGDADLIFEDPKDEYTKKLMADIPKL
ncbi:MAG: ABC transporter ATP-binding protein [Lachnospiraceae bacterium]|nr:ABC transporter ATP-binding protein [Lachnospiraceae bacterium]